jgi:hypothetical protein
LQGTSPEEVFTKFKDHLNDLLHHTVSKASLVQIVSRSRAFLEFRLGQSSTAVLVGKGYHLFLSQALEAEKIKVGHYKLRTLAYAYRIGGGPNREDSWLIRWEYKASDDAFRFYHPRHHCHLPTELAFGRRRLNLDRLHIASGWVTIEEVIRFLIHELEVKPQRHDWDARLRASEEQFRVWTERSV